MILVKIELIAAFLGFVIGSHKNKKSSGAPLRRIKISY